MQRGAGCRVTTSSYGGAVGAEPCKISFVATTWLITRETEDAQDVREARSIFVPCVETKLLPWPWAPLAGSMEVALGTVLSERSRGRASGPSDQARGATAAPSGCTSDAAAPRLRSERTGSEFPISITLFTSQRSVAAWVASGRPELGLSAALRPSTSKALEREGVAPGITSETGVVGLAERVEDWWIQQGRPALTIRYPTSDVGLQSAEQREAVQVLATLGSVDRRIAYQVTAPPLLRETLERVTKEDWSISFASPSAISNFFAAHAVIPRPPTQVACRGASTERAWNEARPESWPAAITTHSGKSPS
jgi:hypothetical protein